MTQGVNASSGGNVSLLPQNPTEVNGRLVVASPGYSEETKGLLVRVIIALMDAIRRFCAGLFFSSEEITQVEEITQIFSSEEITQVLDQLDKLAALSLEGKPLSLEDRQEELEKLLQGLSDRGVHYILGEIAKKILDSAEGADPGRIGVEVNLFSRLCFDRYRLSKGCQSKGSHGSGACRSDDILEGLMFLDKDILDRLGGWKKFKIYNVLRQYDITFAPSLIEDFRNNFGVYAYLLSLKSDNIPGSSQRKSLLSSLRFLTETPRNVEQAFCLLGDIAEYVLVDGNNSGERKVSMGSNVNAFNKLFEIFYKKGHFNDGYSLQNCALWVLNQLEEKDREKAIGVLRKHGSVLVKGLR